ncbi:MAG: hypothetical protein RLZZ292_2200 [Bacteroidota bacterium]|jgi:hypothetical protein
MKKIFILLPILIICLQSCKKIILDDIASHKNVNTGKQKIPLSINFTRQWFEEQQRNKVDILFREEDAVITSLDVKPDWLFSTTTTFTNEVEMLIVPLYEPIEFHAIPKSTITNLVFFQDSLGDIQCKLMFFVPETKYLASHPNGFKTSDFTGYSLQVNEKGFMENGYLYNNGQILGGIDFDVIFAKKNNFRDFPPLWLIKLLGGCPNPGGGGHIQHFSSNTNNHWQGLASDLSGLSDLFLLFGIPDITITSLSGNGIETQGTGGNSGFNLYFPNSIFGLSNVKKTYKNECANGNGNGNDKNTPFLFAVEELRRAVKTDEYFDQAFLTAINYYTVLKNQGISFESVIKDYIVPLYDDDFSTVPKATLPNIYPFQQVDGFTKRALLEVMNDATEKYSECLNKAKIDPTTKKVIEFANNDICTCLYDFNVEKALNQFENSRKGQKNIAISKWLDNWVKKNDSECKETLESTLSNSINNDDKKNITILFEEVEAWNVFSSANLNLLLNKPFAIPSIHKYLNSNNKSLEAVKAMQEYLSILLNNSALCKSLVCTDLSDGKFGNLDIGSNTWNNEIAKIPKPSARIYFKDLSYENLDLYRVIPENGGVHNHSPSNTLYYGDGFYYKYWTNNQYWFKVSGGSSVTVTQEKDGKITYNIEFSEFWKAVSNFLGQYYFVGWEPITRPHNTTNPF